MYVLRNTMGQEVGGALDISFVIMCFIV